MGTVLVCRRAPNRRLASFLFQGLEAHGCRYGLRVGPSPAEGIAVFRQRHNSCKVSWVLPGKLDALENPMPTWRRPRTTADRAPCRARGEMAMRRRGLGFLLIAAIALFLPGAASAGLISAHV